MEELTIHANTYDELEQHLATFLVSEKHKFLHVTDRSWWGIGFPSAVRRTVEALDPARRAGLGKLILVNLPNVSKGGGQNARMVQRRLAEGVLGADAAQRLMDVRDEDDNYSGIDIGGRGVIGDVSPQIHEELWRLGRFLLVIQQWRGSTQSLFEDMGVPVPSKWSSPSSKIIIWDPMYPAHMQTSRGAVRLYIKTPEMDDRLTYIHRELVDLAAYHVALNNNNAMITPQHVLDCLLFLSLVDNSYFRTRPGAVVNFWVHNGLLVFNNMKDDKDIIITGTAEFVREALLCRAILYRNLDDHNLLDDVVEWAWHFTATRAAPGGYQGFQPHKFIILEHNYYTSRNNAHWKELENVEGILLRGESINLLSGDDDRGGGVRVPMYARLLNLKTLVLDCVSSEFPKRPDEFFSQMDCLRVLILIDAEVSSLPNSLFGLPNLRMLVLRKCKNLKAFFVSDAPTNALHGLRVLHVSKSAICAFPGQVFAHMRNLEELLLSKCSELRIGQDNGQISSSLFIDMQALRVLDLSYNPLIKQLPDPPPNLKKLLLSNCSGLKALMTTSKALYSHSALEELDLRFCPALEEEEIKFKMPMLNIFRLSGCPYIRHLSFVGCSKLEAAELIELVNLESLDLSGTAVRELNLVSPFPSKSLIFLGATNLRTFPWRKIQHLPEELILDQRYLIEATSKDCNSDLSDLIITQQRRLCRGGRRVWIHVHDGRFFRMLCDQAYDKYIYSKFQSSLAQQFCINIAPTDVKRVEIKKASNTSDLFVGGRVVIPPHYRRMDQMHFTSILQKQPCLRRHVEIQGSHIAPHPRDIYALLKNALSLSVCNQHSYKSLSELTPMGSVVKQCQMEKCYRMEAVFECSADSCLLQSLETVWASGLRKVEAFMVERGRNRFNWSEGFKNLKHIHLESCPRLRYIFPPGARQGFQSLQVLEILFCPNLKEVFTSPSQEYYSHQAILSSTSSTLPLAPRLRIVHLLHLPSLVSICREDDKHWPALERFKVRGCWRLRKLPFLAYSESTVVASSSSSLPATGAVTIDGEPVWWNKVLQGGGIIAKHVFQSAGIDVPFPMPKN